MKKILIITLEFPPQIGGIATYVDQIASGFDPEGVIVIAPKDPATEEWDKTRKYRILRKNMLFPKFIWPRWIPALWHTYRIVKKEEIKVIFVQHMLPLGYAAVLVKKLFKIPFLVFSHGTDFILATNKRRKTFFSSFVFKSSEQVITNSQSLKRRFNLRLPKFSDKTTILYPCPDQDLFIEPSTEELNDIKHRFALSGKKVILSISRIVDGKGFPHLLSAIKEIVKTDPNIVWLVIGDGPKKELFLDLVQKNNLQNIVRYIGNVPHKDLKVYYYTADIFALLTHPDHGFEEGLGLVFLEAAAAGIPVVAGKSGGVEEGVSHMYTGIVVDTYQHDQAVNAIATLLENKEFADRLGRQARERVKAHFNWQHQLKRLGKWL